MMNDLDKKIVIVLFLFTCITRLPYINHELTHDEAFTYTGFTMFGLDKILYDYQTTNNHVLHNVLMYYSVKYFDNGEFGIRLPAMIVGFLIPIIAYLLFKDLFGLRIGVCMGVISCFNDLYIFYSVVSRGYSLWILSTMFMIYFFYKKRFSLLALSFMVFIFAVPFAGLMNPEATTFFMPSFVRLNFQNRALLPFHVPIHLLFSFVISTFAKHLMSVRHNKDKILLLFLLVGSFYLLFKVINVNAFFNPNEFINRLYGVTNYKDSIDYIQSIDHNYKTIVSLNPTIYYYYLRDMQKRGLRPYYNNSNAYVITEKSIPLRSKNVEGILESNKMRLVDNSTTSTLVKEFPQLMIYKVEGDIEEGYYHIGCEQAYDYDCD